MDANLEVRKAQRQWARSMGIWFDSSGYVRDIQDNLWQPPLREMLAVNPPGQL